MERNIFPFERQIALYSPRIDYKTNSSRDDRVKLMGDSRISRSFNPLPFFPFENIMHGN